MKFIIYWLIAESKDKTYVGFTDDLKRRIQEHKNCKVKTTKNFGNFKVCILDGASSIIEARHLEKYWKSSAGRRKLKGLYSNKVMALSSNG